jgi:hypothetical protein
MEEQLLDINNIQTPSDQATEFELPPVESPPRKRKRKVYSPEELEMRRKKSQEKRRLTLEKKKLKEKSDMTWLTDKLEDVCNLANEQLGHKEQLSEHIINSSKVVIQQLMKPSLEIISYLNLLNEKLNRIEIAIGIQNGKPLPPLAPSSIQMPMVKDETTVFF